MNNNFLNTSIDSWGISIRDQERSVKSAKLSECGTYVILIDDLDQVQTLNLDTNECRRVPVEGRALSIAINAYGEFAVASVNGTVQRFDMALPTICVGEVVAPSVSSIAYDHTGSMLVVAKTNGLIEVHDFEVRPIPALIARFRASDRTIPLLCTKRDVVLGVDRRGRLFWLRDLETNPEILWNGASHLDFDCYAMAIHPFLQRIVVGGEGRYVRLYNAHNATPINLVTSFKFVRDVVFLADVNLLAVIGDSALEVWNIATNCVEYRWQSPKGKVLCARSIGDRLRVMWA